MLELIPAFITWSTLIFVATLGGLALIRFAANVARLSGVDLIEVYVRWQSARIDARTRITELHLATVERRQRMAAEEDRAAMAIRQHRLQLASGNSQPVAVDLSNLKREEVKV